MNDEATQPQITGIAVTEWDAAYAPHIQTHFATRFVAAGDGMALRIAFGNNGRPAGENGERGPPVYEIAIAIPPDVALNLAALIQRIIVVRVEPDDTSASSEQKDG